MRYVFDIETNGLYDEVTKIHSIVLYDMDKDELISCAAAEGYVPIKTGLDLLSKADLIIGHNIINYDLPVLEKLVHGWSTKAVVRDTQVLSRLIHPDLKDLDFQLLRSKNIELGQNLGKHTLKAWGMRLREYKDDFAETADWKNWTPEMQSYCEQDVVVNHKLWKYFENKNYSETAIKLEHDFATIIEKQVRFGFPFDIEKATNLTRRLLNERVALENKLRNIFQPWFKRGKEFTPKKTTKRFGYVAGCPMTKIIYTEFNPGSREHIADRLIKLFGWKPTEFTKDGKPKLDDEVISELPWEEAKLIGKYLMVSKRLGQLAEGNNAWLKMVQDDGRIHGGVITNGTVTGRCTHLKPNVAQVPSLKNAKGVVPYGKECRELFTTIPGHKLLGVDASGLELRMLAHYLYRYDGGAYAKQVLEGDIHTMNQQAAGLPSRDLAKRFIYAWLYGAGPVLIGSLVDPDETEKNQRLIGISTTKKFLKSIPAIKRLKDDIQMVIKKRGYLVGLDGRRLNIRSQHSALNMLLQSAGSILVKKSTVLFWDNLTKSGYVFGNEISQVAHVHDEWQSIVKEGMETEIGEIAVASIKEAGVFFNLNVPMDGEWKVGNNWAETH